MEKWIEINFWLMGDLGQEEHGFTLHNLDTNELERHYFEEGDLDCDLYEPMRDDGVFDGLPECRFATVFVLDCDVIYDPPGHSPEEWMDGGGVYLDWDTCHVFLWPEGIEGE